MLAVTDILVLSGLGLFVLSIYPWIWRQFVYKPKAEKLGCGVPFMNVDWPFGIINIVKIVSHMLRGSVLSYFVDLFRNMKVRTGMQQAGGTFWLGTIEPENIKTILATSFKDYSLGFRYDAMFCLLGDGIFTLSGDEWKHSRALLRPQFSKEQVSHMDSLQHHINLLINRFKTGEVLDAQEIYHMLTIDTATEFLFGESTNTLVPELANQGFPGPRGSVTGSDFAKAFTSALEILSFRVVSGAAWSLIWTPKFWKDTRVCHNFIDYFVLKTLADPMEKDEQADKYVFIRELTKETRNPKAIRDQAFNILLAGRDTTAALLSYTTFYLGAFPEVYQRLRETILDEFGSEDLPLTFEQLKQCKYLQNVIREVLRLHPIVPLNFRTAIRDTRLPVGGGPNQDQPVLVTKGTNVFYSTYSMQRDTEIWGPDAEEFRPDRWTESRAAASSGWDYIPFNGGPRICLGQQFALTEASYTLVRLCQEFKSIDVYNPDPNVNQKLMLQKMRLTSSVWGGVIAKFNAA